MIKGQYTDSLQLDDKSVVKIMENEAQTDCGRRGPMVGKIPRSKEYNSDEFKESVKQKLPVDAVAYMINDKNRKSVQRSFFFFLNKRKNAELSQHR